MGAANKNWNGKVLYQIYPRSFKDSNNDGIGDIKGITSKLEYLAGKPGSLGVDIIWISPFYPSPMADFGYDIKNYKDIDKIFGNLNDFVKLLKKAHKLSLRVMIDFVPNHTSSEHPWFKESRSSINSQKRDWYIWKDPKDGGPPNNWQSVFGGSAWQLDKRTNQYYLHSFHKKQPDLNWENKDVTIEMTKILKFWLDLGVDGFRVDAISWISKDKRARNDTYIESYESKVNSYDELLHDKSMHYNKLFERIDIINNTVSEYKDKFVIYEYYAKPWGINAYQKFYASTNSALCAPFNFSLIIEPWDYLSIKNYLDGFFSNLQSDNVAVFCIGNHDTQRIVDRIGERSAKQAAVIIMTLPGIPTIYYGDELGMHSEYVSEKDVVDPFEKLQPNKNLGRDPARAPMHWNKTSNHGFSEHKAWLKSFESYPSQAYSTELNNPKSFLNIYRQLIHLRKNHPVLQNGKYKPFTTNNDVYGYYRINDSDKYLILNNFEPHKITVHNKSLIGRVVFSTHKNYHYPVNIRVTLQKNESLIIKLK